MYIHNIRTIYDNYYCTHCVAAVAGTLGPIHYIIHLYNHIIIFRTRNLQDFRVRRSIHASRTSVQYRYKSTEQYEISAMVDDNNLLDSISFTVLLRSVYPIIFKPRALFLCVPIQVLTYRYKNTDALCAVISI